MHNYDLCAEKSAVSVHGLRLLTAVFHFE